jgi:hypothetical protein
MISIPLLDNPSASILRFFAGQGLNSMELIRSYLALACFPIADPTKTDKCQQIEVGFALANLLRYQFSQLLDIVYISKASASIDLQAGETVVMSETNL